MTLAPGSRLGSYEITALLGAGGMGEVYRARDSRLGREVAIKVLPAATSADAEKLERFEREARAVAALNHPSIVTIHEVDEADGVRFLAMELVRGEPLDMLIPVEGLPLWKLLDLGIPLADALSAAHEKRIVHRDLKPANIIVMPDGRPKVLDFGLAKLVHAGENDEEASRIETLAKTQEGVVMGTVPYMSPEQVEGHPLDHRTDIFSLGVVLYEMAVGKRPFTGRSSPALMSAILRDTPRPVDELRPELPGRLARLISRCLAKGPADRIQTAREVFLELRAVRDEDDSRGRSARFASASASTAETRDESPAPSGRGPSSSSTQTGARPLTGDQSSGSWIAVVPFRVRGGGTDVTSFAEGLTEDVVTGLSRFGYLKVVSLGATLRYADKPVDARTVGKELGARYVMDGSVRAGGTAMRVNAQLVDAENGAQLWASTYDVDTVASTLFDLQDELAAKLVSTVADTAGALTRALSAGARVKPADQLTPYEAVLRFLAYQQLITPDEHRQVRAGLERAVGLAPTYAPAWACLASVYADEHKQGFNARPDPLGRALSAARRALELDPASVGGMHALAQALYFRGELGQFRAAADRAIALNPMDAANVAFMGTLIAYTGDWERGVAAAERAMSLNPHHPGWYRFASFWDAYRKGDYQRALEVAERFNMPSYFYTHAALAAVNGQLGRTAAARAALDEFVALAPDVAGRIREEIGKWIPPALVEQFMDGLRKAGLEPEAAAPALPSAAGETAPSGVGSAGASGSVRTSAAASRTSGSGAERAGANAYRIAVLPFKCQSADPDVASFADSLAEDITAGLSRFPYLSVIAHASALRFKSQPADVRTVGRELGARYVLEGGVRKGASTVRATVQLVDAESGAQLWAETYNRDLAATDLLTAGDEITDRVVATMADGYGVLIRSIVAALDERDDESLSPAEWGLRFFRYNQRLTPAEHALVRSGLERAVERAPRHAGLWACLARTYVDEYCLGFNQGDDALDRTLAAAQRALELDRTSQLSYQTLAQAHFFRRDLAAFRTAADRALELNPRNSDALGLIGMLLVHAGDFERGALTSRRAMDLNPHHAGWYHFAPAWERFHANDLEAALSHASRVDMPGLFLQHVALAALHGHLGHRAKAAAALKDLLAVDPEFPKHARSRIEAWHYASGLVEPILEGLRLAGLRMEDAPFVDPS